jgi:hypothetical protein
MRSQLEERRVALARDLGRRRDASLAEARKILVATLRDEMLPAWNGTTWAFHGTSQTPRQGEIACGYFVTTTLLHLGMQVDRVQLAQQASELIAKSLVAPQPVRRTSDLEIDAFLAKVRASGAGIYIVGLDNHVGFVVVDGPDTWFHHAAPREVEQNAQGQPWCPRPITQPLEGVRRMWCRERALLPSLGTASGAQAAAGARSRSECAASPAEVVQCRWITGHDSRHPTARFLFARCRGCGRRTWQPTAGTRDLAQDAPGGRR